MTTHQLFAKPFQQNMSLNHNPTLWPLTVLLPFPGVVPDRVPFIGDAHESFPRHEIDRRLTGHCEGKGPFFGTGGLRENAGPLELCEVCLRIWSSLCRSAEGIRD